MEPLATLDPSTPTDSVSLDYVGLDVHKHETQVCLRAADGAVHEQRIRTTRERLTLLFGPRPRARVLLEASTESEWVAQHLEALGHEVIVGDPTYALMYATRGPRVKTDRRDARALADACRLGTYRATHRVSSAQQAVRAALTVREALVRGRARHLSVVRALTRQLGLRLTAGTPASFVARVEALPLPEELATRVAPLLTLITAASAAIRTADGEIAGLVRTDAVVRRLCSVPGVGPVTAACFVASIDDVRRFATAHQLEAYLGLVPTEWSSGERQRRGHITKAGNRRLRSLLVESALTLRTNVRRPEAAGLQAWAARIAARQGRRVATVALARRLAGVLYALWRDETTFDGRAAAVAAGGTPQAAAA